MRSRFLIGLVASLAAASTTTPPIAYVEGLAENRTGPQTMRIGVGRTTEYRRAQREMRKRRMRRKRRRGWG